MSTSSATDTQERTTRIIEMKIPLPWLLGIFATVAWAIVTMWFTLNQLVRDVNDLQITVKAGNGQAVTIAGEIALLRFRVENLEGDRRLQQQGQRPDLGSAIGRAK